MEQDEPLNAQRRGALAQAGSIPDPASASIGDPVTAGLQQLFASIADEPIPEDFLRLLDEIEARAANDDGTGADGKGTSS